ncbi:MAG: hypothetical protein LJE85_14170 [Gammaproteobacteria bacterium]|jgi:hypothetical protein|nr:hypothetical protein [Gammaproteobacteria bacterium]
MPSESVKISDTEKQMISRAVARGAREYFAARRQRVAPFVAKHYSLKGALQINRKAFGKDLVRAPANLLWAMPYLGIHVSAFLMRKANLRNIGDWLANIPPGFRTRVQQEIEWLVRTEFFELPYEQANRRFEQDALLSAILAQPELSQLVVEYLDKINQLSDKPEFQARLAQQLAVYTETRIAAADLACGVVTLSAGAMMFKQLTPGAMSTGSVLAAAIAQQSAISHFVFGSSLGSIYYSVFPASASLGLLAASTGGVLAALGVLSAFSGVLTDPLQKQFGIHQRRLYKLIDVLEAQFIEDSKQHFYPKDHYIARVFDLFDVLKTASMSLR